MEIIRTSTYWKAFSILFEKCSQKIDLINNIQFLLHSLQEDFNTFLFLYLYTCNYYPIIYLYPTRCGFLKQKKTH